MTRPDVVNSGKADGLFDIVGARRVVLLSFRRRIVMNSDELRQAIDLEIRNFGAAAARKDYAAVAGFYTEDAKVLPPDASILTGRKAIEEFWRTTLGLADVTFKTIDLEIAGDTAYEVGETDVKLSSGQAKAKYLVVWLRCPDGRWRLHRDIWNSMPTN